MGYTDEPEISILNHSHGETVCYPLVLLEGKILEKWKNANAVDLRRHLIASTRGTSSEVELHRASKLEVLDVDSECERTAGQNEMEASNLQVECGNSLTTCSIISGGFKTVVPLSVGENNIKLSCSRMGVKELNFQMTYAPLKTSRFVRVVYVLCADSDGSFDAPAEVANDVNAAVKRLSFNARLLQTFMAESLYQHGLERRTFRLEEDSPGSAKVHIFTSSLTTCEALKMTGDQLYGKFSEELNNSSLYNPLCKLWTFMSCTHYDPPPQETFDDKLITKYVKAHTALGGGQLALFGTGGLHTWASDVEQLVPCFTDVQTINKHSLFDDSGGRGFYWANYATGLGASMHELGHCFDLAHTPKGIMARGFDDMNCVFTMWRIPPSGNKTAANEESGPQEEGISAGVERLTEETDTSDQASTPGSTHVGGLVPTTVETSTNQLSLKNSIVAMPNEWSHGAHWYRSSAILLKYHKWLSNSDAANDDDVTDNPIVHWCRRVFGPVGNGGGCHQKNQTMFSSHKWLKSQSATLAGFIVYAGKYVNCIQTMGNVEKLDNGECIEIFSEPQGTAGLGKCYNFVLSSPDEYITGVDVRAGGWIDAIRLHTNWKSSVWMGGTGGDEYHLRPPLGRKVLGLFGTAGKFVGSLGLLLNSEDEAAISEGSGNDDDSLLVRAPLGVRLVELWDTKHSEVYHHWEFLGWHPPTSFTVSRAEVKDKASTLLVEDDRGNIFRTALVYDYSSIVE